MNTNYLSLCFMVLSLAACSEVSSPSRLATIVVDPIVSGIPVHHYPGTSEYSALKSLTTQSCTDIYMDVGTACLPTDASGMGWQVWGFGGQFDGFEAYPGLSWAAPIWEQTNGSHWSFFPEVRLGTSEQLAQFSQIKVLATYRFRHRDMNLTPNINITSLGLNCDAAETSASSPDVFPGQRTNAGGNTQPSKDFAEETLTLETDWLDPRKCTHDLNVVAESRVSEGYQFGDLEVTMLTQ